MFRSLFLLFFLSLPVWGESRIGGNVSPDGREIDLDLPVMLHVKNRGGSDGAGLCVFASAKHSFLWSHVEHMEGIFEWMFTKPGGGWPDKLKEVIETISKEKGKPVPKFLNYEGRDMNILRNAVKAGFMPGITYRYSPSGRYRGQRIAHMVSLVHLDDKWAGILDNNFPGTIEWIDVSTFQDVWTGGQNGWAFIVVSPGPPPIPKNP